MFYRLLNWRTLLFLIATVIVASTIFYSRYLANKISHEERQRVQEWVQALRVIQSSSDPGALALANAVSINNEDIPLIATDERGEILDHRNLGADSSRLDSAFLRLQLKRLADENAPVEWLVSDSPRIVYQVYYGESRLQKQVTFYPIIQLVIVGLFMAVLLSLNAVQHRSAQNQVWAGLAKETAHQLGTPVTSLQGWVEILKERSPDSDIVEELEKDVRRLGLVSDRFAKIGSKPQLERTNLSQMVVDIVDYMRKRASGHTRIEFVLQKEQVVASLSPTLINWVLENLIKNAMDATEGKGKIAVAVTEVENMAVVEVADNGKGIPASQISKVFNAGFSTKKRGWGLGLTLSRRIVEQYHRGKLYVKQSEPGHGTVFRMELPQ